MSKNIKKYRPGLSWLSLATVGLTWTLSVAGTASAQTDWPKSQINLVVPFPPGGSTDTVGRMLANELGEQLKQSFIVENRGGASGIIGSNVVAKAKPDGYTLLLSGVGSNAIGYSMYEQIAYKDADFAHIALLASGPNVLVVNPDFEAKNFKEFIQLVKDNPGKYVYASSGNGSSGHLSMEMLKQVAGLDIIHAPYKGGAAAMTAVMGDQVAVLMLNQDNVLPHVQGDRLRALAVTSLERNPAYPDVPSIAESGYEGFSAESFFGVSAPAGVDPHIIHTLNEQAMKAMHKPAIREKLESWGFVIKGNTPEEFSRFMQDEIVKWEKVVKDSGARMD